MICEIKDTVLLEWEVLARAGRLDDAIEAYIRHYDWVTFAELQRKFAEYFPTRGDFEIEGSFANVILWTGLDREFAEAIERLGKSERIAYAPASRLTYLIDGQTLSLPIVKQARSYKQPHWLPVCFRPNP